MIAILGAMGREIAGIKKQMAIEEAISGDGYHLFRGKYRDKDILLVRTGVGRISAERATRVVLDKYPVSAIISFGFAGGLTGESAIGDIILCSTLGCGDGEPGPVHHSDTELLSQSMQVLTGKVTRLHEGKSISVSSVVCEPGSKSALGEAHHADAVDMESYWIASIAAVAGIPFLAVRAISDTVEHKLPPFNRMHGPDGRLSRRKEVLYFLFHPFQLRGLIKLRRNNRRAAVVLTGFLDHLIERM